MVVERQINNIASELQDMPFLPDREKLYALVVNHFYSGY